MESTTAGMKVKCAKCGDVIQSKHHHDFVTCKCGAVSVDGGSSYLRLLGNMEDILREDGTPFIQDIFRD